MKILLVIDDLGSGGAQRQMSNLALAMQTKGVDVVLAVYNAPANEIFRAAIVDAGIPIKRIIKRSRFSPNVPLGLMRMMRETRYDAVISFLDTPNVYCEVARLGAPRQNLIVSERLSYLAETQEAVGFARRTLHMMASQVVSNSQSQTDWLKRFPWLRKKCRTIYNGYPAGQATPLPELGDGPLKLLAIGRVTPQKNPLLLAQALKAFHSKTGRDVQLTWVGRVETITGADAYFQEVRRTIESDPFLLNAWIWAGEQSDVQPFYANCHAVIHPSSYEGLPNVVCEAMLAGRPVLVSDVCDNAILVKDRERGLVIPGITAQAVADTLEDFVAQCEGRWQEWGCNARAFATQNLSIERMCRSYLTLIEELGARK